MSDAVVQMNVRIPVGLKEAGDEFFARNGLSASEVVRGVWEIASEGKQRLDALVGLLIQQESDARRESAAVAAEELPDSVAAGAELYAEAVAQLPQGVGVRASRLSDRELFDLAMAERMEAGDLR